jgi:hypothetical protein
MSNFDSVMMKKLFLGMVSTLMILGVSTTSCDNTPGAGTAEVKVYNKDGIAQKSILVKMFCTEPECVVQREGRTNDLGVYTESFDLPVVLRVRAVRYDTTVTLTGLPPNQVRKVSVDSVCGEGFIQVENDDVASETLTILSCN